MRKLVIPSAVRPIILGHYTLSATGLKVRGRPDFREHEGVGEFIKRAHKASGFWMADWLRYGESRDDWASRLSQLSEATGISEKRLKNIRAVGAIPESRRRDGVEFGLHEEVAGLEPEEQEHYLEEAETEGYDRRELRQRIRGDRRRRVIQGQAILEGMYRIIYADPPWLYDDRQPSGSSSARHYPGLTIEQLCKLPVAVHTMPNALLAMWVTAPMMLLNPGPREVGEAWGFEYKQQIIWDKVDPAGGNYTQGNHEILTLWTRGSCVPDEQHGLPDSVQTFRKSRVHSEKPPEFRALLEKHWTSGPYLELFGREAVEGWTVFGNDARLWAGEAVPA